MQMNRVVVAGHVVKRGEVRYLPSGMPVANLRLGQTYRFQDGNRQWQERTNWHSLSFYGDLSRVAVTFDKGDNIFVEGTIEQREFTPKDSSKRVVNEIIVRHCHLIASPRGSVTTGAPSATDAVQNGDSAPDTVGAPGYDDEWPVV
jgi:single-strand DNA-binding protein